MITLMNSVNNQKNKQSFYINQNTNQSNGIFMSQSQAHDNNNVDKLDPNWRSDALNLDLDYGMQTIAVRAGQHRTDEGEHSEAMFTTSS